MKRFTLHFLFGVLFPAALFAQTHEDITRAMDSYDYERVIALTDTVTSDSLSLTARVQALKAMNRHAQAVKTLQQLFDKDTTNTKTIIDLAECYKAMGNNRRAVGYYEKAMNLRPENKFFRLQFIRSLLAVQDYEAMVNACHGWLERDTVSATGYKYLGLAYKGMQDPVQAFYSFNIAYRRDSLDAQTVAHIADLFITNEQFQDAVALTENYRLTDTTSIEVNRQCARAYCLQKDYKKAIERYESLKQQGDDSFLTYYYLGVAYFGDIWYYGAYDNLKEAHAKMPTDFNTLYFLGRSAARTSWKKEGVAYMEKAQELLIPTDSIVAKLYDGLAECYGYANEPQKQLEALQQLYKLTKRNVLYFRMAGVYEVRLKDAKNAIRYYERYMQNVPESERYILDEQGQLVPNTETYYQVAEKRIKKLKEEGFFQGNYYKDVPKKQK